MEFWGPPSVDIDLLIVSRERETHDVLGLVRFSRTFSLRS